MSTDNVLVRYTRNADSSVATAALTFDGRPDLAIGQVGYVSEQEINQAQALGVVLEPITEDEVAELGLEVPSKSDASPSPPVVTRPAAPTAPTAGAGTPSAGTPTSGGSA